MMKKLNLKRSWNKRHNLMTQHVDLGKQSHNMIPNHRF